MRRAWYIGAKTEESSVLVALDERYDAAPVEVAARALGAWLLILAESACREGLCERHPALRGAPEILPVVEWHEHGSGDVVVCVIAVSGPVRAVLSGDPALWGELLVTRALELGHGRVVPVREAAPVGVA